MREGRSCLIIHYDQKSYKEYVEAHYKTGYSTLHFYLLDFWVEDLGEFKDINILVGWAFRRYNVNIEVIYQDSSQGL